MTDPGWLDLRAVDPDAARVLVLAPYAGAVHMPLAALTAAVPPGTAVVGLQLPGRGRRSGQPLMHSVGPVVDAILDALTGLDGRRLLLGGYSMGARLMYEVATRLAVGGTPPVGLLLCMSRGPHTGLGHPPVSHLPPGRFLDAAIDAGLAAPSLARLADSGAFVAALHADMRIVETAPPVLSAPLEIPAAVIGAHGDWLVPEPALRAWQDVLAYPVCHLRVDGGHLALYDRPAAFAATVARAIAAIDQPS